MKPQILAFTTNVISFKRENVCLVSSLEKIKEKGVDNILSFSHPLFKKDLVEYLKQYISLGTNHFDLGENTLLTFYEESDELRYNRFKRIWNLKPVATFVKEKKYCISSQYLKQYSILKLERQALNYEKISYRNHKLTFNNWMLFYTYHHKHKKYQGIYSKG